MEEPVVINQMRSAVDKELRKCVNDFFTSQSPEFKSMVGYQMGWENHCLKSTGKRIRPLLLLSACQALALDWQKALPAAAAIELVHNFSLVHDDIQDHSEFRRGKPTVWARWGAAQAINLGDLLLTMGNLEVLNLPYDTETILNCDRVIHEAVFSLIQGQYQDLAFENDNQIGIEEYWKMINGKTGALFSACFKIAACLAGKNPMVTEKHAHFGAQLGLAFQVQDDYLGIWGDAATVGKSIDSDLFSKKKTYPILYAVKNIKDFRELWHSRSVFSADDVINLKQILECHNVHQKTLARANQLYQDVADGLLELFCDDEKRSTLWSLINDLLAREK